MPIFRLEGADISNAQLVIAQETNLELESHLEDWLENSPWALAQEPILWIGRQTSVSVEESTIFPDLLGLDANGNLVIVELKRDEAPREVVAQVLEYAARANELSEEQIQKIAKDYFENGEEFKGKHFQDVFKDVFDIPDTDEVPPLNRNLRLYIVAGSISAGVARVCRFLRTSHGMDINCIDVCTFETEESDEIIVSMETKVGDEDIIVSKTKGRSGESLSHQMVFEAVQEFTNGDPNITFSLNNIEQVSKKKYPDYNINSVRRRIRGDCVNFHSRNNYTIDKDRYWWEEKNKYRLYNREKDSIESNGETN